MIRKYKFINRESTRCKLKADGEKVDVKLNEIIESDLDPRYFLDNGFIEVKAEDVKVKDTPKKVSTKK